MVEDASPSSIGTIYYDESISDCYKGNKVSEEYAKISRESFKPLTDAGIIDIRTFDAITPESPDFEEHKSRYTWIDL